MQDKLADKWAVEIISQKDAERLQELFPKDKSDIRRTASHVLENNKDVALCKGFSTKFWGWASKYFYLSQGYTIYTITELGTILNER